MFDGFTSPSKPSRALACDFPWETLGRAPQATPETETAELRTALPRKYEVLARLGAGASGTVFLARDRFLDRPVALKLLHSNCRTDLERFRREARLMARLQDPAIVRVFEMDELGDRTYVACEYLDGGNLGQAHLAPLVLVRTLRGVVDALAHAHALGVVHRDIKPENILLDHGGRAYLGDFGLAQDALHPDSVRGAHGTPLTMSPEQALGAEVDARSDVYSLGVTLYHSLTGHWPFEGPDLGTLLHALLHADPTPPRQFTDEIPHALEGVVLRCLEKDPARRFQTMDELGHALDLVLEHDAARPARRRLSLREGWSTLLTRISGGNPGEATHHE